jgi:folate-binding Fe-S cluster repair protein YgfZ
VSFEKGCYPGQETVARMHYRGHPNKTLHQFAIVGPPPEPDEEIMQGEKKIVGPVSTVKPVGWITSIAPLPVDGETFALGYLSRNADTRDALHAADATLRTLA